MTPLASSTSVDLSPRLDDYERDLVLALLRRFVTYWMRKRDWRRAEGYAFLWRKINATRAQPLRRLP